MLVCWVKPGSVCVNRPASLLLEVMNRSLWGYVGVSEPGSLLLEVDGDMDRSLWGYVGVTAECVSL